MSAPVLLSHYRMKKKTSSHRVKRESEAPVTLGYMQEFRAEMMARFLTIDAKFAQNDSKFAQIDARFDQVDARFVQIDARFEQVDARFVQIDARFEQVDARFAQVDARFDQVDARFDQMDAKFDQLRSEVHEAVAEMRVANHRLLLLMEEQNLRNKQAYDGYAIVYGAIQDLKNQLKPECFKD